MYRCKSYIVLLFFFLYHACFVSAQKESIEDSLRRTIKDMPAELRLSYLDEKLKENDQSPSRIHYARLLYEEAGNNNNNFYLSNAVYILARHYYSINPDSMRYWINIAEPLFIKTGRIEDICRMKAWDIYALTSEAKNEMALEAVNELKTFSQKHDFQEGIEMADQAMADFYFSNKLPFEGETLYLDVLDRMEKRGAPLIKKFNIVRSLFNSMPTPEGRIKYLKKAEGYLNECKEKGIIQLNADNTVHVLEYVVNRNYAHEYHNQKDPENTWIYMQKADSIAKLHNMARAEFELCDLYWLYYSLRGEYTKGLTYLDKIIDFYKSRTRKHLLYEKLQQKASAMDSMKRYEEAYRITKELLEIKESIDKSDFNTTLANVKTEFEVERLELDKKQMEEQAKQTRLKMMFFAGGCVLLLFVIVGLMYMIRVIQKNKRELTLAKEKAEESDQLKSAFLANMNHEIRTPLNAIVGFSQVLIEEEDKDNRQEFAEIIQNNNELLQRLIGDVLDISKIESNSMSLIYSEQEMSKVMKEIANTIQLRMQPGVELILDPCEPFVFRTDPNRLMQILTNLLTNAIKHTQSGHIRFGYELTDTDVKFYVEDTGEGMETDQLEAIFDRFVQLENGKRGVGLGLAICKGLVTKMGGSIWATSETGKGSTFYVLLPLVVPGKK